MQIDFVTQTRTYVGLREPNSTSTRRRILRLGTTAFDVDAQREYDSVLIAKRPDPSVAALNATRRDMAGMPDNFGSAQSRWRDPAGASRDRR